jgi:hypothetical protein
VNEVLGRRKRRSDDNIKVGLKEIECGRANCIYLAKHRISDGFVRIRQ